MAHSHGTKWAVSLAALACAASGGCYSTTDDGGTKLPRAEDPSNETSGSSMPAPIDGPEPLTPPGAQPAEPPGTAPVEPAPMEPAASGGRVSIEAEPGFAFTQGEIVGDLDGDGFDDLVFFGMVREIQTLMTAPASAAYVFYGGQSLPETLEAGSADAVLRGAGFALPAPPAPPGAAGDLNGDGLADVVVGGLNAVYFLFGSEQRLTGEHLLADVAVSWTFPASEVLEFSPLRSVRVAPAGDVQGDGLFDVTLTVTTGEEITELDNGFGYSPIDSTYLVVGREDAWPSGGFEPDWAETAFVVDDAQEGGCSMYGAADLDGDGFTDLMLQAETVRRLVLGGDGAPTGEVAAGEAGDAFDLPSTWLRALPDLDGDGSQEIVWTDARSFRELYLTYGASDLDPARLVEADVVVSAPGMSMPAVTVTDFDGDGTLELLMLAGGAAEPVFGLYVIPTDGLRDAGETGLDDARLVLSLRGDPTTTAPLGIALDAGGDVNGDGIDDLLITTAIHEPLMGGGPEVVLLLSGTDPAGR